MPSEIPFTPVWGCGLKYRSDRQERQEDFVHPRVGVWIEIITSSVVISPKSVHPRVGVWIEINQSYPPKFGFPFTPVWGCGLKS